MELTPANTVGSPTPNEVAASEQSSALTASSDFETFLSLLTAQLSNQDPLNPLESTDFVAQLASFSSVEQQILTNDRLGELAASLVTDRATAATAWLGRQVLAPASAEFTGDPIGVEITPNTDATRSVLEVFDTKTGTQVSSQDIPSGQSTTQWDGLITDGSQAPAGAYSFQVQHFQGDETLATDRGRVFASVSEIILDTDRTYLGFQDGTKLPVDEVSQVRE